ncbi:MAG: cobalt-precorrin-5B (C(1))-methyltransferase [Salaquimonas sp.]
MDKVERVKKPDAIGPDGEPSALRRGWTTGACATAAAKAALTAFLTGKFPDPVEITLPKGEKPSFPLATESLSATSASVGIIKDAGDDPDVTHGAQIVVEIRPGPKDSGITFSAGQGVGTVTKAGLPIGIGEAAVNPVPRQMISTEINKLCEAHNVQPDYIVMISVPGGEKIAERTWNPRLGIIGGISILGTTGIVHPFSCSAWIHSIMRGVDVCRANNISHALGATGSTSEDAARKYYDLPAEALLDMGDFAGGLLKYLRDHPIRNLTLAGGFAKFTKLAQGSLDLHSGRSQVDFDWLADQAKDIGLDEALATKIRTANTAMEALAIIGDKVDITTHIAKLARQKALATLRDTPINVEVMIFDRKGGLLARTGELDV